MARAKETVFAQSLMERLSEQQELPHTQAASLRFLKEAIRRDLEALLNTRRTMTLELEDYSEARSTVLDFGLEDLSKLHTGPDGYLQEMQGAVWRCLAQFEPRLTAVSVYAQGGQSEQREIRLHIEASLPLYTSVEVVSFDTVFDLTSETYSVG